MTWEAVEHRGPGEYDREYLDYLEAVLARGAALGLRFVVDFHQDVWSRFTGGDGAPGWTLELAGLNPRTLHACGRGGPARRARRPDARHLLWSTNCGKLGAATMATLFFGGDVFAPELRVGAASIQSFLQDRYAGFVREVARRTSRIDAVAGFDLMNEPSAGFIAYPDLASDRFLFVRNGATPSPVRRDGSGLGLRPRGSRLPADPARRPAGRPAHRQPGGRERVAPRRGLPVAAARRVGRPGREARAAPSRLLHDRRRPARLVRRRFPEAVPGPASAGRSTPSAPTRCSSSRIAPRRQGAAVVGGGRDERGATPAHWYDALTMFRKRFTPWLCVGRSDAAARVRQARRARGPSVGQIGRIPRAAADDLGGIPSFVGEFGLPFDLDGGAVIPHRRRTRTRRAASRRTTTPSTPISSAATLWNYTADNTHADGDGWNSEDFSVYCRGHGDAGTAATGDGRSRGSPGRTRPGSPACRSPCATRPGGAGSRLATAAIPSQDDPAAHGDRSAATSRCSSPGTWPAAGLRVRVSDGSWRHDAGAADALLRRPIPPGACTRSRSSSRLPLRGLHVAPAHEADDDHGGDEHHGGEIHQRGVAQPVDERSGHRRGDDVRGLREEVVQARVAARPSPAWSCRRPSAAS